MILFFCLAPQLFHLLVRPVLGAFPGKPPLIATNLTAPLLTPLTLAADMAFLCAIPFGLMQLWQFVVPGLYPKERAPLKGLLLLSVGLFITGVLFCFFLVLPLLTHFFVQALPKDVQLLPDITLVVNFTTRMLLLFGVCFQVPLVCVFLAKTTIAPLAAQQAFRPYAIVAAFILGMLLTPPDVLSQMTLAVPLCLLYELGILLVRLLSIDP